MSAVVTGGRAYAFSRDAEVAPGGRDLKLRIAVVERDSERGRIILDGLRDAGAGDVTVIAEERGLAKRLAALAPDVVLVDLTDPNRDVIEALALASSPMERPVAMFVDESDEAVMRAAIEAGVSAYVVAGLTRERIRPVLTAAVARFHMVARLRAELEATKAALEERKTVDRAKGMLMKAKDLSEEEAYALLRRTAMDQGRKVVDVARALITAADLLK
jgi:response regulator NasT